MFIDRDGTLIHDPGYLSDPDGVKLLPGAGAALRALRNNGFALVVISNQSGIARGLITPEQAAAVHERVVRELAAEGVELDDTRYCPHHPDDGCSCRKPRPGLLLDAARDLDLHLASSVMIGNTEADVGAGRAAATRTIAFGPDAATLGADAAAATWDDVPPLVRAAGAEAA